MVYRGDVAFVWPYFSMEETFISASGVILFCKVRRIRYTNYEQARL